MKTLHSWSKKKCLVIGGLLGGLLVALIFIALVFVFPSTWLGAQLDLRFPQKIASSDGIYSLEIPRSWSMDNADGPSSTGGTDFMGTQGEVKSFSFQSSKMARSKASMSVSTKTLIAGSSPVERLLNNALVGLWQGGRREIEVFLNTLSPGTGGQIPGLSVSNASTKVTFEVQKIKDYPWAKTAQISEEGATIVWQTIDDKLNHYIVTFETDDFSYYELIFDQIMDSFLFGSSRTEVQ
jgi:hypothetical protein